MVYFYEKVPCICLLYTSIAAGVDPETAEVDACRIEHVISNESFERLKEAAFRNQESEISALSKAIKDVYKRQGR